MESDKIRNLIKEAQINKATELFLSWENLAGLPPEISELKTLTELYIW